MKYITLPVDGIGNIIRTVIKENDDKAVLDKVLKLEDTLIGRGFIKKKNIKSQEIELTQLTSEEIQWLKSLYEDVI